MHHIVLGVHYKTTIKPMGFPQNTRFQKVFEAWKLYPCILSSLFQLHVVVLEHDGFTLLPERPLLILQ